MSFRFRPLAIPDIVLVEGSSHRDARGVFAETYRRSPFARAGITDEFVQDNLVRSGPRVLRGLHYQVGAAAQAKLIRVVRGAIFDVAVDVRRGAPTFGQWVGVHLDAGDGRALYIPRGFAHGYCVTDPEAEVAYKVSAEYAPELCRGIRWDDPELAIEWPVEDPVLSSADRGLPGLVEAETFLYDGPLRGDDSDTAPEGEP